MTEAATTLARPAEPPARPRVLVREPIAEGGLELLRARFQVDVDLEAQAQEVDARVADPVADENPRAHGVRLGRPRRTRRVRR